MSNPSRRKILTAGVAGIAGLAAAAKLADRHGLVPPDATGPFAAGNTLSYAAYKILVRNTPAREFSRSEISKYPFPNSTAPEGEFFQRHQAAGFVDWPLAVDGMVARPASYTLTGLRKQPVSSQITQLACEEGWSFVAEWSGVRLKHLLDLAGVKAGARYVVYTSIQEGWFDSLDLEEALHPQTLVTYAMNGAPLPVGNGGPLRLRVPRQLGYKSLKYVTRITVTDDIRKFGKGLGSGGPEVGYSWFAGI